MCWSIETPSLPRIRRFASWSASTGYSTVEAPGLLVVRPDGYVGLRASEVDPGQVANWLSLVSALVTAPARRTAVRASLTVVVSPRVGGRDGGADGLLQLAGASVPHTDHPLWSADRAGLDRPVSLVDHREAASIQFVGLDSHKVAHRPGVLRERRQRERVKDIVHPATLEGPTPDDRAPRLARVRALISGTRVERPSSTCANVRLGSGWLEPFA
jgi:hypothetical protein